MQAFGRGGLKAQGLQALEYLARLYWYTVEFGLITTARGLRVYGAGVLSSVGETQYALTSSRPQRLAFDLKRVLRTPYKIDDYQSAYFVVESFDQLFAATAPDFSPLYTEIADQPALPIDASCSGEKTYPPNARQCGLRVEPDALLRLCRYAARNNRLRDCAAAAVAAASVAAGTCFAAACDCCCCGAALAALETAAPVFAAGHRRWLRKRGPRSRHR